MLGEFHYNKRFDPTTIEAATNLLALSSGHFEIAGGTFCSFRQRRQPNAIGREQLSHGWIACRPFCVQCYY